MPDPRQLVDRYCHAVATLDPEALATIYAPGVRVFDLLLPIQLRGHAQWREQADSWFGMSNDTTRASASEVEVRQTTEMALLTMLMEYSHEEDGERLTVLNRLTWVAVPHGEEWRIVHEHTSVPLAPDDMAPVFGP